jgi:copper(I)-binding protein
MNQAIRHCTAAAILLAVAAPALAGKASDTVSASDPYVRHVPPGMDKTGAYVLLRNGDKTDHALVAAASPAANAVELHTVIDEGGMKKMVRVPKMDVKAGGETKLQPGGLHIMLIGLKEPLKEGASVPITLKFEDGSEVALKAPVRPVMMPKPGEHTMPMKP